MSEPDPTARRLVRQLDASIERHRASGDAFVASVYGEWGVGKTYCLRSVERLYAERLQQDLAGGTLPKLTVPVWFDPWRYEHEEHLVVPMLKVIEQSLQGLAARLGPIVQAAQDHAAGRDDFIRRQEQAAQAIRDGATTVGRVAQALLSAVKFKAAPFGVGLDIDARAAIEQSQKLAAADRPVNRAVPRPWWQRWQAPSADGTEGANEAPSETLPTSFYFDAQHHLASLVEGNDAVKLRLVVLVDDLDRCLPEKAVQVLESVKLFLNVPGFSFVLAVDDEVVERGIAHRYRQYREGGTGEAPISGAQYLEKIVHLPVHLPRWPRERAQSFLRETYPDLYGTAPDPDADRDRPTDPTAVLLRSGATASASLPAAPEAAAALRLVLDAVPRVPRKLIRLSEGVEFLRAQFQDLGASTWWDLAHALRVVAIQQLHPALYRHLRQDPSRYWRMFELSRNTWDEPEYRSGDKAESLDALRRIFETRKDDMPTKAGGADAAIAGAQTHSVRERFDLLERVQHSSQQRGAGDPIALFRFEQPWETEPPDGLTQAAFADLYFAGLAPKAGPTAAAAPAGSPIPEAAIVDLDGAYAALSIGDAVQRRAYIEQQDLAGKRLPPALLQRLIDDASAPQGLVAQRITELPWLRDLTTIVSPEQLEVFYAQAGVIERWARVAGLAGAQVGLDPPAGTKGVGDGDTG